MSVNNYQDSFDLINRVIYANELEKLKEQYQLDPICVITYKNEDIKKKVFAAVDDIQELIDKTTICGIPLNEAIPIIQMYKSFKFHNGGKIPESINMFDEKLMMYNGHSIAELIDLRTPKEVFLEGDGYADGSMVYDMASCPNCGERLTESDEDLLWEVDSCPYCGQKLHWSKGE